MTHPRLGEMRFEGHQSRRSGLVTGVWKLTPPGLANELSVVMPVAGTSPSEEELASLETFLGDLDALFEESRAMMAPHYAHWVGGPLPADWRSVFRVDGVSLPDHELPDEPWSIDYWCEGALHWFVVERERGVVTHVAVEG